MNQFAQISAVLRITDNDERFGYLEHDSRNWNSDIYGFKNFSDLNNFREENTEKARILVWNLWVELYDSYSENIQNLPEMDGLAELFDEDPYAVSLFLGNVLGEFAPYGWLEAYEQLHESLVENELASEDSTWLTEIANWLATFDKNSFEAKARASLQFEI